LTKQENTPKADNNTSGST